MIAFRVLNLGRNCKNFGRVYKYCFVNNTETYLYFKLCSLILIFSTLCVVHELIQGKRLSIVLFTLLVLLALRLISFMQRFKTTWD